MTRGQIELLVSVASLIVISITLYSVSLQIKHTRLQLKRFEETKKDGKL